MFNPGQRDCPTALSLSLSLPLASFTLSAITLFPTVDRRSGAHTAVCNHVKTHYTCVSTLAYVRWRTFLQKPREPSFHIFPILSFSPSPLPLRCQFPTRWQHARSNDHACVIQFRLGSRASSTLDVGNVRGDFRFAPRSPWLARRAFCYIVVIGR